MRANFLSIDPVFRTIKYYRVVLLILAVASCSDDDDDKAEARIKLATSATLGDYLTDSEGNTLYFFSRDAAGANMCTGGCTSLWPVFYEANLTQDMLDGDLSIDDFGTVTITGGAQQTTYKGWPLYYYAPNVGGQNVREQPGEINGDGFGTVWYVAKPDYTIMLVNAQLVGANGTNYTGSYEEGDAVVQYFTDGNGRTLYFFTNDSKDTNTFTNGNATHDANWPVYGETLASVPSTLDKSLFGSIDVLGSKQLTYKGWPIYYFGSDTQRGNNKGVSVPTPGIWRVVVKDAEEAPE